MPAKNFLTSEYIHLLIEVIEKEPSELGYDFGRCPAKRLSTHLAEKTGIELSSAQVRRILKERKSVYLWAKSSRESKQNQPKRKAFKKRKDIYQLQKLNQTSFRSGFGMKVDLV